MIQIVQNAFLRKKNAFVFFDATGPRVSVVRNIIVDTPCAHIRAPSHICGGLETPMSLWDECNNFKIGIFMKETNIPKFEFKI